MISKNEIKTEFGIFNLNCKKSKGERINLLITQQSPSPARRGARGEVRVQIKLKVEDIVYKQNQFEVKSRGVALSGEAVSKGVKFLIKQKPKIGQTIKINVQVKCLE
ncbi:MAG: hypothetical protein UZ14_CFX002003004 [Chloroflexi bacterium OLB14]|nr:MAG: hypothetical protein UZ14_CFX002003004 [Chloroflexi bacterium OLB14]